MKSWLAKNFISYLVIGLFPLLLGIIYYYTNITTIRREVENGNFGALTRSVSELDYLAGEMRTIAYHFSGCLAEIPGLGDYPYGELPAADRALLAQQIQSYQDSLGLPVNILVYFRGSTLVYTSNGAMAYGDFEAAVRQ